MRVVVTGGSGRIGQWVVRELADGSTGRTPHQVTVFDRVPGPEYPGVRYLLGDVEDLGQVVGALAGADAVIHMAAIWKHGIATNEVTFRVNVMGTFNVHEAAWRLGIRRVLSTSSAATLGWDYREREFAPAYLPIDEDHPLRPQDAYGLSKVALEAVARSYTEKCGMETVVIRPPGVFSPEQMDELHRGNGRRIVDFRHCSYVDVRDLARTYRLAVERPIQGNVVLYVAADDSTVAEPLCKLLPRVFPPIGDLARELTGTKPGISNARIKQLLGWQPERSWRDASRL